MIITASRRIAAPAEKLYDIIADYRNGHPRILPKQFQSLVVEKGGVGAGTVIRCEMRAYGKTQEFRAVITEPRPGRELVESNMDNPGSSASVTTFRVEPEDTGETLVTITTDMQTRSGLLGRIEGYLIHRLLHPMYVEELHKLEIVARSAG